MRPSFLVLAAAMPMLAADFSTPENLPPHSALPDPLTACDGSRIGTREQWEKQRAPELRELFQHYMYGRQPAKPARARATLHVEDRNALDGAATLREWQIDLGLGTPVNLLVVTPNRATTPAPCFLGLNFYGNHQVLPHPGIALPQSWVRQNKDGTGGKGAREEDRGKQTDVWNVRTIVERGYAFATFFQSDVVPDDPAQAKAALTRISPAPSFPSSEHMEQWQASNTATIMAWAWGFSRMLDHLETVPEVDAKRVATVGHSRNGKTALLAAAFDERFALAIPSQAGCGGTAPSRVAPELAKLNDKGRPTAETVAVITKAFPHWFCGLFTRFGAEPERLPFDQHELIALCAPRPVLVSNATEDLWANPDGQFEMLRAADPVYRLVAGDGVGASARPPVGKLLPSRLGYFIREGKHSMALVDWSAWLDYADQWLKKR